tara:strand:- start:855 stop:1187 length:333 start_codon:yes stop_codon:yes gene_type:complete
MALQNYLVTLPNGLEGGLDVFYDSIVTGLITPSDAGYVLEDGSILPTNGEPYMGVTEEDLLILLGDYITPMGTTVVVDDSDVVIKDEPESNNKMLMLLVAGLIGYILIKK